MKRLIYLPSIILWSLFATAQNAIRVYPNYDFIPGEKVLFEDNFADTKDGEFPPHWNLIARHGVVNRVDGEPAFVFTDATIGSVAQISPRIKTAAYLTPDFTVEEDFFLPQTEMTAIYFKDKAGNDGKFISLEGGGIIMTNYFEKEAGGQYPDDKDLFGQWHHLAMAYKNKQIKIYVDHYTVLVIPDCGFEPVSLLFGGSLNVKIKNVKIAARGNMNMLDKILTDGKFISHAIKFDSGKSNIKGEGPDFLNDLARWLKANPTIKLEIGGYTDSDGDDASNLKLSQSRADAIKTYLVSLGIQSDRLTARGYGKAKPIDNNSTPEGKANNRRVEFVRE